VNRFTVDNCIAHSGQDAKEFAEHLRTAEHVLFIGTVGLDQACLYFSTLFAQSGNVDFKFIIEERPSVPGALANLGNAHQQYLKGISNGKHEFRAVEVIARDGATTGGRNVTNAAMSWLTGEYSDVVIDVTGMSRGVCFPLVKFACDIGLKKGFNVHVVVATSDTPSVKIASEANDRADWMHGFQGSVESDRTNDDLKLWVPQLTEGALNQTALMHGSVQPTVAEICPIIPFPSREPRRGDDLIQEYSELLLDRWEGSLLNIMYAHESDPIDAYRSIHRMHAARESVFSGNGGSKKAVTILSPAGWRIGSLGMLLAAIELSLPVLYVEAVGYNVVGPIPTVVKVSEPSCLWHIWLAGNIYDEEVCTTQAHAPD
jgi:hypothetical protein